LPGPRDFFVVKLEEKYANSCLGRRSQVMKHLLLGLGLMGGAAAMLTGCYSAPVIPPVGYIYSDYKAPLDADYDKTEVGMKSGSAESISILGLFATGDCSAKTAADNGGIHTIQGADYTFFNVLGVYQRFNTVVYGE
jgi:hypothetical protein